MKSLKKITKGINNFNNNEILRNVSIQGGQITMSVDLVKDGNYSENGISWVQYDRYDDVLKCKEIWDGHSWI